MVPLAPVRRHLVASLALAARTNEPPAALVKRLEAVQVDPVNLLARNHELVLFARLLGRRAGEADYYLGGDGLFEYIAGNRALIPIADLPLFIPFMRRREELLRETLTSLAGPVRRVLREIEANGPLASRRIACPERTRGYWDGAEPRTKETTLALQLLWEAGRLTVVGRSGSESLYDLAERAFPTALVRAGERMTLAEAGRRLLEKYYRAMVVFDAGSPFFGWQRMSAAERAGALEADEKRGIIEPLPLAGVKRRYWACAGTREALADPDGDGVKPEARFLPPLDNLLWRRERLADIFGFDYRWEIYTPPAKRTGGPYTMPILYGDRLVGRLDARLDRKASALIVDALRYEPGIMPGRDLRRAVGDELERLGEFCGAGEICRRDVPAKPFVNLGRGCRFSVKKPVLAR